MSDLHSRIDRLEQDIGQWPAPARWRNLLAPYFTAPVYDGYREALLDTLCGPNPTYHFVVNDGPDRGYHLVAWWTRNGPPVVIHILAPNDVSDLDPRGPFGGPPIDGLGDGDDREDDRPFDAASDSPDGR